MPVVPLLMPYLNREIFMSKCCHTVQSDKKESSACSTPNTCHSAQKQEKVSTGCCEKSNKFDYLLWASLAFVVGFYSLHLLESKLEFPLSSTLHTMAHSVFELFNTMWWSVLLAIVFVGVLGRVPQHFVTAILGKGGTKRGLCRATLAGVLMDLCSHGILMVGMKLYQKGASLGQVMAFLIASPWNSLSLTFILIALIGLSWTLTFIVLSMVLALTTGWCFDRLVDNNKLPKNSFSQDLPDDFQFFSEAKQAWQQSHFNVSWWRKVLTEGLKGTVIVLRWLLFGIALASLLRSFISIEQFQTWFGPSIVGLMVTLVAATIIEVCSEGSSPIAADLMNRAKAPGNSFAFLMTGIATDYTEVMVIKQSMNSWKIALFLPLLMVPQVIVFAIILNSIFSI